MTYEEAHGITENRQRYMTQYRNMFAYRSVEANGKCIEALEKQIPKKPTFEGDGYAPDGTFVWDEWLCPRCGTRYEVDFDKYDFCPNCGQRIDWEEDAE